jgi:hypothetical protein
MEFHVGVSYLYTKKVYGAMIGQHNTPQPFRVYGNNIINLPRQKKTPTDYYFNED